MPIYFAQVDGRPEIKVGYSVDLRGRLISLQTAHVADVRYVRVCAGTPADELRLHRRWQHLRVRGEWFTPCDEMFGDIGLDDAPMPEPIIHSMRGAPRNPILVDRMRAKLRLNHAVKLATQVNPTPEVERITEIPRHLLRPDICPAPTQASAA